MVLLPDDHIDPGVCDAMWDVEDAVIPMADVFPLQPPLLIDETIVFQAQNNCSKLVRLHSQPRLVDQRLPLPLPKRSVSAISPVHHDQLISAAIQTQVQTVQIAEHHMVGEIGEIYFLSSPHYVEIFLLLLGSPRLLSPRYPLDKPFYLGVSIKIKTKGVPKVKFLE